MVARVAATAGREVGPVVPGRSETRSGREVWWAGHEGALLPDLERVPGPDGLSQYAAVALRLPAKCVCPPVMRPICWAPGRRRYA